jgi:hypothetical protein
MDDRMSLYNNEILLRSSYNIYNKFLLHATMSYLAAKANSRLHLLSSLVSIGIPDTHMGVHHIHSWVSFQYPPSIITLSR